MTAAPGPDAPPEDVRFMAERLLASVREDIGRADAKAAILLSGAVAVLAVLVSDGGTLPPAEGSAAGPLLVAAALCWAAGLLMLVAVILPRTRIGAERTLLRDLAAHSSAEHLLARLVASRENVTGWLLDQASVHGAVLAAKYRWLRLGVGFLALGGLLALFSELW
ncbi:Pycsar system effector family protein [Streptomyces sp. PR69]|uniref:Pycsar system effector family protein n=1 Tax=Streptomyces sp. PR69 TaxID=2984950 RepID=UPI002264D060|nr:Pycsar system effector family protein [Streptomyces sp. PR69]